MTQPIPHRLVISAANLGNNPEKSNKMMHYFTKNNIEGEKDSLERVGVSFERVLDIL